MSQRNYDRGSSGSSGVVRDDTSRGGRPPFSTGRPPDAPGRDRGEKIVRDDIPQLPKDATTVAVDTETTGGLHPDPPECARVAVVSVAWRQGEKLQSIALPFAFGPGRGAQPTLGLEPDPNLDLGAWRFLLDWLAARRLVFHGAKFDLLLLLVGTDEFAGVDLGDAVCWDTMLASRDLDPGLGAELEQLEQRWEGPEGPGWLTNKERSAWLAAKRKRGRINQMGWDEASVYAATDAEVTYAAYEEQALRYEQGEGSRAVLDEEIAYTKSLFRTEARGIGYDAQGSLQAAQELKRLESKIAATLPFRATNPAAKRYFYTVAGETPTETTATGKPKLDDTELGRLVSRGVEHAETFQRLTKLKTARTKWYESYAEHTGWDGRLRTTFSQAKVQTGRLSSGRINLQAIPHDYQLGEVIQAGLPTPRALFVPKPGAVLWELDLEQAELRVAAQEARCESMLELVRRDADLHGEVATQLFGSHPGDPSWHKDRSVGKRADFAFIFGVGAEEFQKNLFKYSGIWLPIQECERLVQRWRRLYPEYGRAILRYQNLADRRGWIRLINGRVRHFNSFDDSHKAFNAYVQGSLAELVKLWLLEVDHDWPDSVLLQIHDSLVLELPEGEDEVAQQAAKQGEVLGTELFGVPMVVEVRRWE